MPAVPLPCMCASFRRAARALTQLYDDALRPLGLRVTQFTILQALSLTGEISQGDLGRLLVLDSTTLTRTLHLMRPWIEERPGKDRRERRLRLSRLGRRQLERVSGQWEKLQSQLRTRMGERRWDELHAAATEISNTIAKPA